MLVMHMLNELKIINRIIQLILRTLVDLKIHDIAIGNIHVKS